MSSASKDDRSKPPMDCAPGRLAQLRAYLDSLGIDYTVLVHDRNIAGAQDGTEMGLGTLSAMAPTFILRTEGGYLAAILRGDTRLAYKKIKQKLGLRNVSLATPEQVEQLTGSEVGSVALVTPGIRTILDARVTEVAAVYGGSGEPKHTLRISPPDLIRATQAQVFDFAEFKD
jgi:prolyl-tRNA editing enzyme YbaK/EbsC (Cys-tRNA(Pro) deacylase)